MAQAVLEEGGVEELSRDDGTVEMIVAIVHKGVEVIDGRVLPDCKRPLQFSDTHIPPCFDNMMVLIACIDSRILASCPTPQPATRTDP